MYIGLTPELTELRDELRDYYAKLLTPEVEAELSTGEGIGETPRRIWKQMAADGWAGIGWPKEWGGQGRSAVEQFVFFDESMRAGAPVPMLTINTVGPTIMNFGSDEQKEFFLPKILKGEIHFCIGYTEPGAGTDLASLQTKAVRDGDEYVINGRKWWITGAMSPAAKVFIVMGKTDPDADRRRQQSMILVPRDTPGLSVVRGMEVFGYDDHEHGGHAELVFRDVRVPASNLIGEEGDGFAIAQARLGPGRIHHCMRAIGVAERAIELMCQRSAERVAFGKQLARQGVVREWIAESRVRIEQLRLLVLKTAWLMDTVGNKGAHTEIQAIKIATPATVEWILDKAIQVHGGGGLSQDFPLAQSFAGIRTLRFADGPDEVHKMSLGAKEIKRQVGL